MELMKKVQQLVLGLVVLMALGCGKDDDSGNTPDPNIPINQKCKLTETTYTYNTEVATATYQYNSAGKIEKITSKQNGKISHEDNIEYDAAGRVFKVIEGNGVEYVSFEYDTAGLLTRENHYRSASASGQSVLSSYYTYEYDPQKQLVWKNQYNAQGNTLMSYDIFTYPYSSAVTIHSFQINAGTSKLTFIGEFTFDNRKSVGAVFGLVWGTFSMLPQNNILTIKSTQTNPARVDNTTYTYTYNTDDLPIKFTAETNGTIDGVGTYTYTCQ